MRAIKLIRDHIDTLVHPSARQDALTAARHRAFIASRLLVGIVVLAALPEFVALRGAPSLIEMSVFSWFLLPMMVAYFLSHTGRYESAHILSFLSLFGFGAVAAIYTGGILSFAVIWFVVAPIEAALCSSRRVFAFASILTFATIAAFSILGAFGGLPPTQSSDQLATLGVGAAAAYVIALALGARSLQRASSLVRKTDSDRYRLLAGIMTDAITRHDGHGAILFASPAAEPLFGIAASELMGNGLYQRVHVADRPAYLTALADAAAYGHQRSVEVRVRRGIPENGRVTQFIWVEMRCQLIEGMADDDNGQDRQVIAVMRDITERRDQEEAITDLCADIDNAVTVGSKLLSIIGRNQTKTIHRPSDNLAGKVKKSA